MNIILTGGSGNLGKAVIATLQAQGHTLITSQSPRRSSGAPSGEGYVADLTDENSAAGFVQHAIRTHGHVDAAVLLTGGYSGGSLQQTGAAELRKMYSLNFESAYFVVRPLLDHMLERNSGRVILIGARPALNMESANFAAAYALAKSQVIELARLISGLGSGKGVTAHVIVPSIIDTPDNRKAMPNANFNTWVKPADLAETIAFLLSAPAASLREAVLKMYGDA